MQKIEKKKKEKHKIVESIALATHKNVVCLVLSRLSVSLSLGTAHKLPWRREREGTTPLQLGPTAELN